MDPRRHLILASLVLTTAGLGLTGCAVLADPAARHPVEPPVRDTTASSLVAAEPPPATRSPDPVVPEPLADAMTRMSYAEAVAAAPAARPDVRGGEASGGGPTDSARDSGRRALVAANVEARTPSGDDSFVGGVRIFAWSPGRVYEVWTAPLRVTTLTLGAGETLVSKAAGDTVRWQIGETTSGNGAGRRTHVLLKPLQRGLDTNLVLTTNRRVYLVDLKSGAVGGFNAAVAWDTVDVDTRDTPIAPDRDRDLDMDMDSPVSVLLAAPQGPFDARYRIEPQGRRARWTPVSVFNDGQRTFIAFDPDLQIDEAPALFVVAPDGESQMVNYRQTGGLFIVDRVFDRAELRLGDRRPQVVRIRRIPEAGR